MLVQKKRNVKKLSFMIILLVVVVAVAVWYFAFGSRSKKGPAPSLNTSLNLNEELPPIGSINAEIFKDPRFSDLKQHGTLPVEPGQTGKDNPFSGVTTK